MASAMRPAPTKPTRRWPGPLVAAAAAILATDRPRPAPPRPAPGQRCSDPRRLAVWTARSVPSRSELYCQLSAGGAGRWVPLLRSSLVPES